MKRHQVLADVGLKGVSWHSLRHTLQSTRDEWGGG